MSGINSGSRHMYQGQIDDPSELLERIAKTRLVEEAKRQTCQCREPVKVRKYCGQWVCTCGRMVAE